MISRAHLPNRLARPWMGFIQGDSGLQKRSGLSTLWKTGTEVPSNGANPQNVYTGVIPNNTVVQDGTVIYTQWGHLLTNGTVAYRWVLTGGATATFDSTSAVASGQGRLIIITLVRRSSNTIVYQWYDTTTGSINILNTAADWTQTINLTLQFLGAAVSNFMEYSFAYLLQ